MKQRKNCVQFKDILFAFILSSKNFPNIDSAIGRKKKKRKERKKCKYLCPPLFSLFFYGLYMPGKESTNKCKQGFNKVETREFVVGP